LTSHSNQDAIKVIIFVVFFSDSENSPESPKEILEKEFCVYGKLGFKWQLVVERMVLLFLQKVVPAV
jgi:hypothetical protein